MKIWILKNIKTTSKPKEQLREILKSLVRQSIGF